MTGASALRTVARTGPGYGSAAHETRLTCLATWPATTGKMHRASSCPGAAFHGRADRSAHAPTDRRRPLAGSTWRCLSDATRRWGRPRAARIQRPSTGRALSCVPPYRPRKVRDTNNLRRYDEEVHRRTAVPTHCHTKTYESPNDG